jgi:hypothetical protein
MFVPVGLRRLVIATGARGWLRKEQNAPSRAGRTAGPVLPLAEKEGGEDSCRATACMIQGVAHNFFDTPGAVPRRPAPATRRSDAGASPQPPAGFLRKNGF